MTYISGKITGLDIDLARNNFESTQIKLAPVQSIHPFEIRPLFGISVYLFHMIADIWALFDCDSIYMMPGWEDSRGSRIELWFAKLFKIGIYYENDKI